jgi:protein SCO1/2
MRPPVPRKSGLPVLLGAAAVLLALTGGYLMLLGGTVPPPGETVTPWSLTGDDGHTVSDRDLRGRYLLLYFGYTSCADVCPATLAVVSQVVDRLGAQVQPVFITVDPARDTPAVMHRYVRNFGPRLIGLTGSQGAISAVLHSYRIEAVAPPDPRGDYQIEHTSVLLLVGPDGRVLIPLAVGEDPNRMAARIRQTVSPGGADP